MAVSALLWNIIAAGRGRNADIEELRKVLLLNALMIPGLFFTLSLGFVAIAKQNYLLAGLDFTLFAAQVFIFRFTRTTSNLQAPVKLAVDTLLVFFMLLAVQGGIENTGILWSLIFPSMAVFLMGTSAGLKKSGILFAGLLAVFALEGMGPVTGSYSLQFQIRFMAVFVVVAALSVITEELRRAIHERLKNSVEEKDRAIEKLNRSIKEIKTLQGILPICLSCKKIRDDEGYWQAVDKYIHSKTDARFSHALCPECADKLYSDYPNTEKSGAADDSSPGNGSTDGKERRPSS